MFLSRRSRQTGKEVFTIPLSYDAQGKPSVGKKGEPLVVTFRPLELMDDPERYLGVHFNYRGSTMPQVAITMRKVLQAAYAIGAKSLSPEQAVQMLQLLVVSRLRYPIPAITLTKKDRQTMDIAIRTAFRSATRLNPGAVLYYYLERGGLAMTSTEDVYFSTLCTELFVDLNSTKKNEIFIRSNNQERQISSLPTSCLRKT